MKKQKKKTTAKKVAVRKATKKKAAAKKLARAARKPAAVEKATKKASPKRPLKVAVFGGTFDPIHNGHLNSIATLISKLKCDEFLVVPANQNPFRLHSHAAEGRHRIEMARLALAESQISGVQLFTDEIDRGGVSYTVETLTRLRSKYRGAEFYLCMGADQLVGFDRWKDYKKILGLANLIVTTRPGHEIAVNKAGLPAWLQSELKTYRFPKGVLKSKLTIQFVELDDIDVSASEIRRKVRRGENVEHLTPHPVAGYIVENKVYTAADLKISNYREFTRFCSSVAVDRGALSVNSYDLRQLQQPAEFAIVGSGTSTRHVRALCESIVKEAKEQFDIYPQSTEGLQEGRWVIIDYGTLMIHFFYDFVRNEYRIEELWSGAPRIENQA